MEAVPRLPMISFDLLTTTEKVSFAPKLKPYIASFYQEDPESYTNEIHGLEGLRASAVWPTIDINSCQIMKKYYCQLHFLKSRFPMESNQIAAVNFAWRDDYTKMSNSVGDINFEQMCMLFNIGALHSKLGAEDTRHNPDGMKMACTHFQCAAWAFQTVREIYGQLVGLIMISTHQVRGMQLICLAQAQECILEKSLLDNRKATIIAKIAMQLSDYYRESLMAFQTGDDGLVIEHLPNYKYILAYLLFKIAYTSSIALLYQGQHLEEQQKMGERVTFYNSAVEALENARKHLSRMGSSLQAPFKETLTFALDVIEGKRKAATNENEFIYHEEVPQLSVLPEIKGASLVKGIPFSVHDTEVSGQDIFGRLVPMEAHEASSLYSEQKAQLLRQLSERVEFKDKELNDFMSSLQLDILSQIKNAKGLSQELVDRAASMVARPTATKDLIDSMGKLSNTYHDVESMLTEIKELLNEEEQAEKDYQNIMGKRPPSIIATDLAREASKYKEAHAKASESNQNLHKAMTTHVSNLKILSQPLGPLSAHVPSLKLPDPNVDEQSLEQIEHLVQHVDKMKNQRTSLWTQLRDNIHKDDITGAIVTKQPNHSLEAVFQKELEKHNETAALIDQNLLAQDNICKAMVQAYAKFTPTRKYLQDILLKRNNTIAALVASHDAYDDLLAKANKGIDFYLKLETNVNKLLQRIKSACKVQQEEREQILIKNGHPLKETEPVTTDVSSIDIHVAPVPTKPRLKDYLDSLKEKPLGPQMQYPSSSIYPNQETWVNNTSQEYVPPQSGFSKQFSNSMSNSNYGRHGYTQVNYTDKNLDQSLVDKMNALKVQTTNYQYDYSNSQAYNQPVSYPPASTPYSIGTTNLHTAVCPQINTSSYSNPAASYQTVSSTNYPYIAVSEQQAATVSSNATGTISLASPTGNSTNTTPTLPTYSTMSSYNANSNPMYQTPGTYGSNYDQYSTYGQQNPNQYYNYQSADGQYQYAYYAGSTTAPYGQQNVSVPAVTCQDNSSVQNAYAAPVYTEAYPTTTSYNATQYPQNTAQASAYYSENTSQYPQYPPQYTPVASQYPQTTQYPQSSAQYPQASANSSISSTQYPVGTTQYPQYIQNTQYSQNTTQYPQNATQYPQNATQYPQNATQYPQNATIHSQATKMNTIPENGQLNVSQSVSPKPQNPVANAMLPNNTQYPQNVTTPGVIPIDNSAYHMTTCPYNTQTTYPQTSSTNVTYPNNLYTTYNVGYVNSTAAFNQPSNTYFTPYQANPVSNATNTSNQSLQETRTQTSTVQVQNTPVTNAKESSVDLLAGIDFTISQAPLIPQKEVKEEKQKLKETETSTDMKEILPVKKETKPTSKDLIKKNVDKVIMKAEPFRNGETVKQFLLEVDRFEKYVESLNVKTLSGPSTLDLKWKEVQECLDNVGFSKKSISVARCYPQKNRSPDFLPFDSTRVELTTTKDDYINASHIKNVNPFCMDFIVTQSPMHGCAHEFWAMVWEQQVETIVCLMSDDEIGEEIYWPGEIGKELSIESMFITMLSTTDKGMWAEKKLNLMLPEQKENKIITVMQFTSWPGSIFPSKPLYFINFLREVILAFDQQKCSGNPVLVTCQYGVGRSGICTVLLSVLMEFMATACPLPDIPNICCKIHSARKNILRDREHLKFVYVALLSYFLSLKSDFTKTEKSEDKAIPVQQPVVDPLSTLDPLWATKKM